ncbi:MAG: hypothetical protein ACK55I_22930, partial [bacterium]
MAGDRLKFGGAQSMQLVRVTQLAEVHAFSTAVTCNLRRALWRMATSATVGRFDCKTGTMHNSVANPYGPQGFPLASPYLQHILRARVYDVAIESPLDPA